jgi:hypothetical protein
MELKAGAAHGKLAGPFSKWFARFADGLGITDPRKTFTRSDTDSRMHVGVQA